MEWGQCDFYEVCEVGNAGGGPAYYCAIRIYPDLGLGSVVISAYPCRNAVTCGNAIGANSGHFCLQKRTAIANQCAFKALHGPSRFPERISSEQ